MEKSRCELLDAKLPASLWAEALNNAVYLTNRSLTKALNGKTPYEALYGHPPELGHIRVFGCDAYVLDEKAKSKGKMAPHA